MKVTVSWLSGTKSEFEADSVSTEVIQWKVTSGKTVRLIPVQHVSMLTMEP